jgi:hypothetical protein
MSITPAAARSGLGRPHSPQADAPEGMPDAYWVVEVERDVYQTSRGEPIYCPLA